MAGDYIFLEHELPTSPEVVAICGQTGDEIGTVLGRLALFWFACDRHTEDGTLRKVTPKGAAVAFGGNEQFWLAVQEVGWAEFTDEGMHMPGFEKRFSKSARRRIKDAQRKSKDRADARWRHPEDRPRTECGQDADAPRTECGRNACPVSEPYTKDVSTNVDTCADPSGVAPAPTYEFPIAHSSEQWKLPPRKLDAYLATYAGQFDIHTELRKARLWLVNNKDRRKTKGGMLKFLTSWLNRASDSARARKHGTPDLLPDQELAYNPETGEFYPRTKRAT